MVDGRRFRFVFDCYSAVMTPRTYRITVLGCRVNHAESREIESVLRNRGLERAEAGASADLEVVHSCSVTQSAAAKSRQAIRRAARRGDDRHSNPEVVVTGCYAGTDPIEAGEVTGDPGRVVPQTDPDGSDRTMIDRFASRVDVWLGRQSTGAAKPPSFGESSPIISLPVVLPEAGVRGHVRAEVRIQDGCDAHCTFCVIPKIRRTLRSKTIADAVAETQRLVDLGHPEVVLSGIFIGAYGHETALRRKQANRHASPLADLLDAVAQVNGLQRVRISSMEPGDVDEPLLDAMVANRGVVASHLHLPLQSGSDRILRKMNRQYTSGDYLGMIAMVNAALTEDGLPPAITTDVICGFPGETDEDFQRTVSVAKAVGYLHMHVFPYSPRAGTAAARWTTDFVQSAIAKDRVRQLIGLETAKDGGFAATYLDRMIGRTARFFVEQTRRVEGGFEVQGRCDHYAMVRMKVPGDSGDPPPRGTMLRSLVRSIDADTLIGEPAPRALPLIQIAAAPQLHEIH